MSYNYSPTPNEVNKGYAVNPFANDQTNPIGSIYASTYSKTESDILSRVVMRKIYDASNQNYDPLKILYSKGFETVADDTFEYKERVFGRQALTVHAWNNGTQTITVAGTFSNPQDLPITVGDIIYNANGVPARIVSITHSAVANSTTCVVAPQTGVTLGAGAFANSDVCAIQGALIADGMDRFLHYDRMKYITRHNYVQFMQRNRRWTRLTYEKYVRLGQTDYMDWDKNECRTELMNDLFSMYFAGVRGEMPIAAAAGGGTDYAKMMGGLYPTMIDAGAPEVTVTTAGLISAFETLAFQTNYKSSGGTRMIYGTPEMLYELSKLYKEPGVRYTPNDMVANLNLNMYKLGAMNLVPVPVELFRESSVLPSTWANRLLIVDQDSITPVSIAGRPHIEVGQTTNKQGGSYRDYTDYWVAANMSIKYNNPLGGFIINVS